MRIERKAVLEGLVVLTVAPTLGLALFWAGFVGAALISGGAGAGARNLAATWLTDLTVVAFVLFAVEFAAAMLWSAFSGLRTLTTRIGMLLAACLGGGAAAALLTAAPPAVAGVAPGLWAVGVAVAVLVEAAAIGFAVGNGRVRG